MVLRDIIYLLIVIAGVALLALPLGHYLAEVLTGRLRFLAPIENIMYRIAGVRPAEEQNWKQYAVAMLVFNLLGIVLLFTILLAQGMLPYNPRALSGVSPWLALNIAVSFVTNTNWQSYAGETTLSPFSQMFGLTVQNFLSPATGLAVAAAVIRGFAAREQASLGNFYADALRVVLYLLLPLSLIFAVILIACGVPETWAVAADAATMEGGKQTLSLGPVAGQIAIKMLGSNGGGYFNANGAHPFENPTAISNFFETVSIIALPVALVIAFGKMLGKPREARALLIAMGILFFALLAVATLTEQANNPLFARLDIDQSATDTNIGGNMEGKEVRFGSFPSTLWAVATTATSNGSVNAMHESLMPLTGLVTLFNMLVGEVIFGGVGCGLYGILVYVLITVFIAGLMVGRTPEYLGKKIEAYEIKLAVLVQILYPLIVLFPVVWGLLLPVGNVSLATGGSHGLSEMLYAYASAASNNGSAFAGFNANTNYQNGMLALVMALGRFAVILPLLAIAGSMAAKKSVPPSSGTFPTDGGMFIILLVGVIVMLGGLTYFPALVLGPVAEHLMLFMPGAH